MPDDATLKRLWQARKQPGTGHPDEAAWERLMCDELPEAERTVLLEHVTACDECGRVYHALLRLEEDARAADSTLPGRTPAHDRRPWALGGLAAAATLLVGSWLALDTGPRATTAPPTFRSAALIEVRPVEPPARVKEKPARLSWETSAEARAFRARLFTAEGALVWSSARLEQAEALLPPELPLEPGDYLWDVTLILEDGRELESEPFGFTLQSTTGPPETPTT